MIRGLVGPDFGAVILVWVRLESGAARRILFLVDTGSSQTILAPRDAKALGIDLEALYSTVQAGARTFGIGGSVPVAFVPSSVSLDHVDGSRTTFILNLAVALESLVSDLPSILGRDVLFRGQLSVGRHGLTFDIEPGEHEVAP